ERVGGFAPPRGPVRPPVHALGRRHLVPARVLRLLHESVDGGGPAYVAQEIEEDRYGLEPVPVPLDHRMTKLRPHRRRFRVLGVGHGPSYLLSPFYGHARRQVKTALGGAPRVLGYGSL